MVTLLRRLWTEDEGQGMAEYGLILSLVAIVVIVALGPLGKKIAEIFGNVTAGFEPEG